ncbi:MAG TPA: hypothetical protein VF683_03070, partial [Chthoniobacterales bacterium]
MKARAICWVVSVVMLLAGGAAAQSPMPAADTSSLDFKQWGLLAVQEGGRRKPVDTFAREALIKITGRSTYTAQNGKRWQANDFIISGLLETQEWKNEPMVLVSLGSLIEQLGLDKNKRRFSFAELSASPELNRLAREVQELRRAEKPLSKVQQEVRNVSERLTLLNRIMDGSGFLIIPAAEKVTDPWVIPPAFGNYYKEEQFAAVQTHLQAMAGAYMKADSFQFSTAARDLREAAR